MSAEPVQSGGLSRAQRRIEDLLSELNATVEQVDALTRSGRHREALTLVQAQRESLYASVDSISHDVAARRQHWYERLPRHAAVAAAAALALSTLASVGVALHGERPATVAEARAAIEDAQRIADPVARIDALEDAVRIAKRVPATSAAQAQLSRDLLDELNDAKGDIETDDPEQHAGALRKADELAASIEDPTQPTPPQQEPVDPAATIDDVVGPRSDERSGP